MTGNNPLFPEYLGMDLTQYALVALVALGMALAFIVADRHSATEQCECGTDLEPRAAVPVKKGQKGDRHN